jgi:hypothetical protein
MVDVLEVLTGQRTDGISNERSALTRLSGPTGRAKSSLQLKADPLFPVGGWLDRISDVTAATTC